MAFQAATNSYSQIPLEWDPRPAQATEYLTEAASKHNKTPLSFYLFI